ncbi:MAG TPA: tetratricopeptide repeat protein [Chthoniobacteraceae bacterium]|jgi:predicted O-linked N-acetylglucosamine transferase (SPINDLY family)
MPQVFDREIRAAGELHRAGRLAEAEAIYRKILAAEPDQPQALHLLGILASQTGRNDTAIELLGRVVAARPDYAQARCDLGNAYQGAGKFTEAVASYREALRLAPDFADANNNLGNALHALRQYGEAITAYGEALRCRPDFPIAYNNLGNALLASERRTDAIVAYRQALERRPNYADAHCNLGIALCLERDFAGAVESFQRAISCRTGFAPAHFRLGGALLGLRRFDEAIAAYREAIRLEAGDPRFRNDLGSALIETGQLDEAVAELREAIRMKPDYAEAWNNLGVVLLALNRMNEAIAAGRSALLCDPKFVDGYYNLANALKFGGNLDEAGSVCRKGLEIHPDHAESYNGLGNILKEQGRLEEAIAAYRQAVKLKSDYVEAQSNLILTFCYWQESDPREILAECLEWERQHAAVFEEQVSRFENDRSPERRLRVGYVSPDFRFHVAGRQVLSLLRAHDRERVEIFCYSNVLQSDSFTQEIRSQSDHWRNIVGLPDETAAAMIRADRIDILVDLALHTARQRLLVFARKPAPIQVTYLGYPGTSGLRVMDYRLSDPQLDPLDADMTCYREKTFRLPHTYWCYEPLLETPPVSPLPATTAGYVTFGCLNNFAKVSAKSIDLWLEILVAVPSSRLLLHAPRGDCQEETRRKFARRDLTPERLEFVERCSWAEYLQNLQRIDIALDPFPFNGGITTCDALWMGIPMVTLSGASAVGRAGRSVLFNLGLPELVAETPERYREIALELAGDLPRVAALRASLRERFEQSSLRDAAGFACNIESAYRAMWKDSCSSAANG